MSSRDTDDTTRVVKTAVTNPRPNTFVPVSAALQDGCLLYRPEDNAFIALYPDEFLAVRQEAEANNQVIKELQAANQAVTEASLALLELKRDPAPSYAALQQAQLEVDQALNDLANKSEAAKKRVEAITDLKTDPDKLVELVPLTLRRDTKQKAWYVSAERLKSALADRRIYLVEGEAERHKNPEKKAFEWFAAQCQQHQAADRKTGTGPSQI